MRSIAIALAFLTAATLGAGVGRLHAEDRFDAIRNDCINTPIPRVQPPPVPIGLGPWESLQGMEEHRGLVYRNLEAQGQTFLRSFYIAFFELGFALGDETTVRRVRYCSGDDDRSDGIWDPATGIYRISFTHHLTEPSIRGDFKVAYRTRYGGLDRPCAGRHAPGETAFQRRCAAWVPAVDYSWQQLDNESDVPQAKLVAVTAFFRMDYGKVGLTLVSDPDSSVGAMTSGAGIVPIVLTETSFTAVDDGAKGAYDNLHTVYPTDGRRTVVVPGCRWFAFDCVHMHFRWGGSNIPPVDPLIDPSTMQPMDHAMPGSTYLEDGQTVEVALTADNGEGDVADPMSLVNGETLATATTCEHRLLNSAPNTKMADVVKPVVVWYIATSKRPSDSFFRHGLFALESLKVPKLGAELAYPDIFVELWRQDCDRVLTVSGATLKKVAP